MQTIFNLSDSENKKIQQFLLKTQSVHSPKAESNTWNRQLIQKKNLQKYMSTTMTFSIVIFVNIKI